MGLEVLALTLPPMCDASTLSSPFFVTLYVAVTHAWRRLLTLRECNYDLQDAIIFAEINWGYKCGDTSQKAKACDSCLVLTYTLR
jgi:hypothetical protein